MGVSYVEFFNGFLGNAAELSLLGDNELTNEFIELAKELIDETIEKSNAIWYSIGDDAPVANDDWDIDYGPTVPYGVKILFYQSNRQNEKFLQSIPDTALNQGTILGLMYKTSFVPSLKDTIRWNNQTLNCVSIDPIAPVNETIIYNLMFKL